MERRIAILISHYQRNKLKYSSFYLKKNFFKCQWFIIIIIIIIIIIVCCTLPCVLQTTDTQKYNIVA